MKRRRNFLLLEVLIAFSLIALCIFPLVYSQFKVLTAEKELHKKLEGQRQANDQFVQFVERLYKRELALEQLNQDPTIEFVRQKEAAAIIKVTFQGNDYQIFFKKNEF